jgi:holo-[acyl-carrier protein] synthase
VIGGIGIDLIARGRIARAVSRFGDRFLARLLTERELAGARGDLVSYVAGRFAAKEAASKALGTGFRGTMRWRDVEVLTEPSGAPRLQLHGEASRRAQSLGVTFAHVSLTHDREYAAAVAVLEVGPAAGSGEHAGGKDAQQAPVGPGATTRTHEAGGRTRREKRGRGDA